MKVLYRISLFFVLGAAFLYLGVVMTKINTPNLGEKDRIINGETESSTESYQEVSTQKEEKVTASTEYRVRYIQDNTNEVQEKQEKIPVKYIGLSREELEEEIQQYVLSPSLQDLEKGFVHASLESFSNTKIVVNKTYHVEKATEEEVYFFLVAENHFVTVYRSDQKTVYLNTEISMDSLPEELQNEILDIKYMDGEGELYNFLESYSS